MGVACSLPLQPGSGCHCNLASCRAIQKLILLRHALCLQKQAVSTVVGLLWHHNAVEQNSSGYDAMKFA